MLQTERRRCMYKPKMPTNYALQESTGHRRPGVIVGQTDLSCAPFFEIRATLLQYQR